MSERIVEKLQKILEHPLVDSIAKFIKKFKSSKSYWSVSFLVLAFTFREAVAWRYGSAISAYAQKQLEGSDYSWVWAAIEFIFDFGGNWVFALGGLIIFIILSLVKVSEGENNTIILRESFLSLVLLLTLLGMVIYSISNNDKNHQETHNQQKITNNKLDEIKVLITKLQGKDKIEFLKKYFGKDYAIILNHPKTYHNFTTLLKQTHKSADELLKEREKLLKKVASQNFNPNFQKKINKAFQELRYEDVRKLIDDFLKDNKSLEENLIKAHHLKALSYLEQQQYFKAKKEFENIASNVNDGSILFEKAYTYYMLGNYKTAIKYYNKLLNVAWASLQDYNSNILTIYDYIGLAYYGNGQYGKALRYYEKSLKLRLLIFGKNDSSLLTNYLNIGLVWDRKGTNDKAQVYYDKCFNFTEKNFVPVEKNKKEGYIMMDKKIYSNTLNFFFEFKKVLIYRHRYLSYMRTLFQQERIDNAIKLLECPMTNDKIMYDTNNTFPSTAIIYESIAIQCSELKKYNMSMAYFNKALKIQLLNFTGKHPAIARLYENIGSLYKDKKEYKKALKYYQKSLNVRLSILQKNHMDIAINYHFIGSMLYRIKEYKKSINYYKKALNIFKNIFPKGHRYITITMKCLKRAQKKLKSNN